jgi:hypothetical protein
VLFRSRIALYGDNADYNGIYDCFNDIEVSVGVDILGKEKLNLRENWQAVNFSKDFGEYNNIHFVSRSDAESALISAFICELERAPFFNGSDQLLKCADFFFDCDGLIPSIRLTMYEGGFIDVTEYNIGFGRYWLKLPEDVFNDFVNDMRLALE